MNSSDKMEKYLNKRVTYDVETLDKVYARSLDKSHIKQDKYSKMMKKKQDKDSKMMIRDEDGNEFEVMVHKISESEDGVGTMTYTAMHPHGGAGRLGYNKGMKCPHCGKNIDLRR